MCGRQVVVLMCSPGHHPKSGRCKHTLRQCTCSVAQQVGCQCCCCAVLPLITTQWPWSVCFTTAAGCAVCRFKMIAQQSLSHGWAVQVHAHRRCFASHHLVLAMQTPCTYNADERHAALCVPLQVLQQPPGCLMDSACVAVQCRMNSCTLGHADS